MRKSALLIAAAALAVCLPGLASAAPAAAPKDPNANSKKFVGDWVGQIFVPGQSLLKPKAVEPAKTVGKKPGKKKTAKAKSGKKKG
jgi:hypothetical protein